MRARILIIKLSFLLRVSRDNRSLNSRVFRSLATSEVESLIIVRQCRFLESPLQSNFTSSVLASPKHISITSMKKEIIKLDHSLLLSNATLHPSQRYIHEIAANPEGIWPKIGDSALEKGIFGTSCTLALLRFLSLHTYSDNQCPFANCVHNIGTESPCAHFLAAHTNLSATVDDCVHSCINCTEDMFIYGQSLFKNS